MQYVYVCVSTESNHRLSPSPRAAVQLSPHLSNVNINTGHGDTPNCPTRPPF